MYNTAPISLKSAVAVALTYIEAGIIPLFVSSPGVGKTTMAETISKALNATLVQLRLNNLPPEEALGLQFIDEKNKRTIRYAPSWVPAADGSDGPKLVFMDELMQAPDEYRKGIMSALLERYIGEHSIPANCMFMAAGNSVDDGSNVFELDTATAGRFGVIRIRADLAEWIDDYAEEAEVQLSMIAYLRMRPDHLDVAANMAENDSATIDDTIIPSPRSWSEASRFLTKALEKGLPEQIVKAGLMGKLGETITNSYWMVHGMVMEKPSLDQLLSKDEDEQRKYVIETTEMLWAYGQAMIWTANDADRVESMLLLLDRMTSSEDVQYVEVRTHITESVLVRANRNGVKVTSNENIRSLLKKWEHQINPKEERRMVPERTGLRRAA